MARMHARKKGRSGSTKPKIRGKHSFVSYSREEVEDLVVKLRKGGSSPSSIGIILRDSYGVPSVKDMAGSSIGHILKKNSLSTELPEDLENLIKKAVKLRNHLEKNKRDTHNKHGLQLIESKIHRLSRYYKSSGVLPEIWRYEPEKAKLKV